MTDRVAQVAVDVGLAHLDRPFDYLIPAAMADDVQPGVRVRVRFAGRLRDGFVMGITDHSDSERKLAPLNRVVSPEVVMTSAQASLIRAVADHYGGVFSDVARLAIPGRHAATEAAEPRPWPAPDTSNTPHQTLAEYPGGSDFCDHLASGAPVRAFWQVSAFSGNQDWIQGFVHAVVTTLKSGRGVIIVVPDARDISRVRDRLAEYIGLGAIAVLHSDAGVATRYRNYLAIVRGMARVVVGTRSAVYAPVHDLGLICLFDDGDDLHCEQRAPYPHARDVAAIRANLESSALLFASHARTAEMQTWIERGWLVAIEHEPSRYRLDSAPVRVAGDSDAALDRDPAAHLTRLPRIVFDTLRTGLENGPVLVQVPRAGYLASLSCARCRTQARCSHCSGPLRATRAEARHFECGWCGQLTMNWACPLCGDRNVRARLRGSSRTSEELGRAFPGVRVIDSSADRVVDQVSDRPALVVATPGGEPHASGGYSALALLDAHLLLDRPDLRSHEEAFRRWMNALALVRSAADQGTCVIVGPSGARPIQALVRHDPAGFARLELADRRDARFPPAFQYVSVTGDIEAVEDFSHVIDLPAHCDPLGPVEDESLASDGSPQASYIVRAPIGVPLVSAVKAATALRSAKKRPGRIRVDVDPQSI